MFDTTAGGPSNQHPDIIIEAKSKKLLIGAKYIFNSSQNGIYRIPFSADPFSSYCLRSRIPSALTDSRCMLCSLLHLITTLP